MGYYTYFKLYELEGDEKEKEHFKHFLEDSSNIEKFQNGKTEELFYEKWSKEELEDLDIRYIRKALYGEDSFKWYDWERDMIKISLMFPTLTFYISGEGEENNDLWKAKIQNGKSSVVQAEIVYPDFDF